jgi:prolyl oligopeptidase
MTKNPRSKAVPLIMAAALPLAVSTACSTTNERRPAESAPGGASSGGDDPYLWLEEVESKKALDWVQKRNTVSEKTLIGDPLYAEIHRDVRSMLVAKDRIPYGALRGGWVYNFWQDADHVKGLWRRTRTEEYAKADPQWDVILDIDALAKQDGKSWVWRGSNCLPPEHTQCLISLSPGGSDAVVVREFDVERREFVKGGFELPEAKSDVAWMDADTIWVGTNFGDGSLTSSSYPRITKLWKRGTPLSQAKTVYEGKFKDVAISGYTVFGPDHSPVHLVMRAPSFFTAENFVYRGEGQLQRVPFPIDADFKGVYGGFLLASMRSDWKTHKQGSLLAIALDEIDAANPKVETVYTPDSKSTLTGINGTRDALYLDVLTNVQGQILKVTRKGGKWVKRRRPFPDKGTVSVVSADPFGREILESYESFLVPPTLYVDGDAYSKPVALKSLPARFDASPYEVKQHWAVSKDGTKVPYFLVSKKGMKLDREQPTLLYGYGGFEASITPSYSATIGKAWLDRGGAYAVANIRGGGEFGPRWHRAALLEHRQRAYDDFIAVAADLNRLGISKPERIGIMGGSNGGLLMGVMLTQRPDLFGAIVCQVPLLDMLRYHKMEYEGKTTGASWMGEYGNPDDPGYGPIIERYSPYQNIKRELKYPRVFIETSTKDDRVHPGHARKMVARLEEYGKDVLYFENIEGGHSAAADLEQSARRFGMEYTYLWRQLGVAPTAGAPAPAAR